MGLINCYAKSTLALSSVLRLVNSATLEKSGAEIQTQGQCVRSDNAVHSVMHPPRFSCQGKMMMAGLGSLIRRLDGSKSYAVSSDKWFQ